MDYLEQYYNDYDEDGRLLSRHGQVEYLTTMKYVRECLAGITAPAILEVGAGTGRYSVTLAKQGFNVTAVELVRTEDIAALDAEVPVKRIKLVAADGATNYKRELIDAMDDETFGKWMDYHFAVCERQDLIGASHHTLDILRKI